ncbi:MAG TPA: chloride channel protein, partial [Sedimentisphaerales bacterium]|nr:chloride channel protein [Sedimentisphaerales bacterium]
MPDQKEKHPIGPHLGHAILSKLRRFGFGEESFLIVLAVLIGCLTSLGSIVFIELVYYIHGLCYGQGESEGLYRGAWFMLLLLPMLGALFVGFITFFYSEEVRGHGVSEVMCAIARRNGVIRARVALAKAVASALTIGSGGSAGTEGPIIQIGSAIGSSVGQRFRAVRYNMPVLVGCGAAAGIASIFNAPIAGVLFALEVFLRDVSF